MTIKGKAYIAGVYEHPTRKADEQSLAQLHAESAMGALADAHLTKDDVDGYFCAGDAPGLGGLSMADYMGLKLRHVDTTETGGSSYVIHVAHAAEAIAAGKCDVALITLAGRPRAEGMATGTAPRSYGPTSPDVPFEFPYGPTVVNQYAMAAMRHMHQYGTTSEQLAWIKVAASHHAQHNPLALLRDVVTVADVVSSPMISDPLHRLDCCVITDGGGAIVVVRPEVAARLARPRVRLLGAGEAVKHQMGGRIDITYSGAVWSGPAAFAEAGVKPADIKYASIYDSFTITVLITLEDLGFCAKGQGGKFVSDGNLIAGTGKLPFNTDGGGLCNNHPANRGGLTKVVEAVRQLRGEAHPAGAGQELRRGPGARDGRLARHAPRQRHADHGERVMATAKERVIPAPPSGPEIQAFWDAAAAGRLAIKRCAACGQVHHYPRALCPFCGSDRTEWRRRDGPRDDLLLQRHAPRAGALCAGVRDPRRGRDDDDEHRRLRSRRDPDRPGRDRGVQADGGRAAGPDVQAGLDHRRGPRRPFPSTPTPQGARGGAPAPRGAPARTSTLAPATSRVWPATTTLSPFSRPLPMMLSLPWVRATTTGRFSTVAWGFTTKAAGRRPCRRGAPRPSGGPWRRAGG